MDELKNNKRKGRPKKREVIVNLENPDFSVYGEDEKKEAIKELWRSGVLSWKLRGVQKIMYDKFHQETSKRVLFLCSRRLGKTTTSLIIALEYCLQHSNIIVKYLNPHLKDAKTIIRPIMRQIMEDCPTDVIQSEIDAWREADKQYVFGNGSCIQLGGCDQGNAESLRGGASHLAIIDEAGFSENLTYNLRSIIAPTLTTTRGKMLILSTPSKSPSHEFLVNYVFPLQAENRLVKFTIHDNPNFTKEDIDDIIKDYPEGVNDPDFRREYLCEVVMDMEKMVINNFTPQLEEELVKEVPTPNYYDPYVSMDLGFVDLTFLLFGYYDFNEAKLVILDELIMDGPSILSNSLSTNVYTKEKELFVNPLVGDSLPVFKRISDNNNPIFLNELDKTHGLKFKATKKDDKDAQINAVKMMFSQKKIIIHPRCRHLLYHIKNATWNRARDGFNRLKDTPNKTIRGGHCDGLDALIYLVRNLDKNHNPYPFDYLQPKGENVFQSLLPKVTDDKNKDLINTIFNKKAKKKDPRQIAVRGWN